MTWERNSNRIIRRSIVARSKRTVRPDERIDGNAANILASVEYTVHLAYGLMAAAVLLLLAWGLFCPCDEVRPLVSGDFGCVRPRQTWLSALTETSSQVALAVKTSPSLHLLEVYVDDQVESARRALALLATHVIDFAHDAYQFLPTLDECASHVAQYLSSVRETTEGRLQSWSLVTNQASFGSTDTAEAQAAGVTVIAEDTVANDTATEARGTKRHEGVPEAIHWSVVNLRAGAVAIRTLGGYARRVTIMLSIIWSDARDAIATAWNDLWSFRTGA